jgi:hypothetical protein
MIRIIIATLVGAVLLFVYQFLSWEVLPIHEGAFKYVPEQDSITAYLSKHLHDDAVYAMPMPAPGSPKTAHEDLMKKYEGKPTAIITWHNKMGGGMMMMMIMGFIIDLIAVLIVASLLMRTLTIFSTFFAKLRVVLMFSFFMIFQTHLMNFNWFNTPWHNLQGEIVDGVLAWFIVGCWLAWYLGRGKQENLPAIE